MATYSLTLPCVFKLLDEHLNNTISFLRLIGKLENKTILLDFSGLNDTRVCDMMVFMAQVEKASKVHNMKFYISKKPRRTKVQKALNAKNLVWHKNVELSTINNQKYTKENLITPQIIVDIVTNLKVIGIKEYYEPFYIFLNELIGNATEHGIAQKNINWWLTSYIVDKKDRTMRFVFVDMGIGIISSYKKAGLPFKYHFFSDKRIPVDAFNGTLGSSTKMQNRGKGLPQLKSFIENGIVSDFVLITNNVSLSYVEGNFVTSKNFNFVGTYYSWTINKRNFDAWKSTQ